MPVEVCTCSVRVVYVNYAIYLTHAFGQTGRKCAHSCGRKVLDVLSTGLSTRLGGQPSSCREKERESTGLARCA